MRCPFCSFADTRVVDSRVTEQEVRRRRECEKCAKRFTTREIASLELVVMKKDGRREPFQRGKILSGLLKACNKLPITQEQLEQLTEKVERKLYRLRKAEVPSTVIGETVMKELRRLDHVAYLRFASVCKAFTDPKLFEEELALLKN